MAAKSSISGSRRISNPGWKVSIGYCDMEYKFRENETMQDKRPRALRKFDVVFLNETESCLPYDLPGYTLFRSDVVAAHRGGCAVFVAQGLAKNISGTLVNKPRAYKWRKLFFKQKFGL